MSTLKKQEKVLKNKSKKKIRNFEINSSLESNNIFQNNFQKKLKRKKSININKKY